MNFLPRALPRAIILFLWLAGLVAASPDSRPRVPAEPSLKKCLVGDSNGDRIPDILVLDSSGRSRLLAPDGSTLCTPSKLCHCLRPFAEIAADVGLLDVNGDGFPDLLLRNSSYEIIAVFLNLGRAPGKGGKPGEWLGFAEASTKR